MLNLADFALQEQLEGNLMVAISRAWYNGSYTIAAKPIKSLELHYTMIQFLIKTIIPSVRNIATIQQDQVIVLDCIKKNYSTQSRLLDMKRLLRPTRFSYPTRARGITVKGNQMYDKHELCPLIH